MSTPTVHEDDEDVPHPDDYERPGAPPATSVEQAKDFLLWCRKHGFGFQTLHIGDLDLAGIVDSFPRAKPTGGRGNTSEREPSLMEEFAPDLVDQLDKE